ncbi:hypothetical protein B5X24_HaOG217003 [Helicoverpa armigera]|uniref:Uncharacterized protein n=1 Tax=Helicoverpa armigera TaxID=29058 RepID=A0A2W1C418_HELAM|nr:hypothetical protein B5X24_HaOG217003 [Helicoverpa armigera]
MSTVPCNLLAGGPCNLSRCGYSGGQCQTFIIIISSAIGPPLLNIGLPLSFPEIPVGGDLHPASSGDLYKVVCPRLRP